LYVAFDVPFIPNTPNLSLLFSKKKKSMRVLTTYTSVVTLFVVLCVFSLTTNATQTHSALKSNLVLQGDDGKQLASAVAVPENMIRRVKELRAQLSKLRDRPSGKNALKPEHALVAGRFLDILASLHKSPQQSPLPKGERVEATFAAKAASGFLTWNSGSRRCTVALQSKDDDANKYVGKVSARRARLYTLRRFRRKNSRARPRSRRVLVGFRDIIQTYKSVRKSVIKAVVEKLRLGQCKGGLTIAGHGTGGAMAEMLAAELMVSSDAVRKPGYLSLITFGAPRAIAGPYHSKLGRAIKGFAFVNGRDVVANAGMSRYNYGRIAKQIGVWKQNKCVSYTEWGSCTKRKVVYGGRQRSQKYANADFKRFCIKCHTFERYQEVISGLVELAKAARDAAAKKK
jgi:Lipase (class 3)